MTGAPSSSNPQAGGGPNGLLTAPHSVPENGGAAMMEVNPPMRRWTLAKWGSFGFPSRLCEAAREDVALWQTEQPTEDIDDRPPFHWSAIRPCRRVTTNAKSTRSPQQHQLDGGCAHRIGRAGRRGLEYARSRRSGRGQSRAPDDGTKQSGAGRLACDHSLSQWEAHVCEIDGPVQRRKDYCGGLRSGVRVARAMKSPTRSCARASWKGLSRFFGLPAAGSWRNTSWVRADRLKTAPIKAVHTLTAALKEGQTGLRILSAFHTAAKSVGAS